MINICNAVPFQIKKEQFSSIQNGREREWECVFVGIWEKDKERIYVGIRERDWKR